MAQPLKREGRGEREGIPVSAVSALLSRKILAGHEEFHGRKKAQKAQKKYIQTRRYVPFCHSERSEVPSAATSSSSHMVTNACPTGSFTAFRMTKSAPSFFALFALFCG